MAAPPAIETDVTRRSPSRAPSGFVLTGARFGVAAGFLYGYAGVPAYPFMEQLRTLGAGFTKIYVFWNQVEPRRGDYDWTAIDTFLDQVRTPEEALVAVFSSSVWATVEPSPLRPSPARSLDDYYRFVHALVEHCEGRVRYWQNDSEPNNPVYWAGTKEDFVAHLRVFHRAVTTADVDAVVVAGGYDGLFGPPGMDQFPHQEAGLAFFDHVLDAGREAFDVFDLRLYADPYTIPARVDVIRQKMRSHGYEKPIICTEYGGPSLFQFAVNRQYLELVATWSDGLVENSATRTGQSRSIGEAIADLYARAHTLPPETQMFMQDCAPELDARYQRLQASGIVMRNLLALCAGVERTIYWYLPAPRVHGDARFDLMALMYGKIGLVRFDDGRWTTRTLSADVFERMARTLAGVRRVTRVEVAQPNMYLFEADRGARGLVYVAWERRDDLADDTCPPVPVEWPWPWAGRDVSAVDAFGCRVAVVRTVRHLRVPVSSTPVYVETVEGDI